MQPHDGVPIRHRCPAPDALTMQLGFRGRLVLGVTTLVVAFAGAALAVLGELGNHFVAAQIRRQVAECRGSFERQMELRLASWRREAGMFAGGPQLAPRAPEPATPTTRTRTPSPPAAKRCRRRWWRC